VGGAVTRARGEVLVAGEAVQDLQLRRGEREAAMLVLSVEGDEPRAQCLQVRRRRGASGNEGAGAAACSHPAPEDDLVRPLRQPLRQLAELGVIEE
jgi:hypothetical protein